MYILRLLRGQFRRVPGGIRLGHGRCLRRHVDRSPSRFGLRGRLALSEQSHDFLPEDEKSEDCHGGNASDNNSSNYASRQSIARIRGTGGRSGGVLGVCGGVGVRGRVVLRGWG